MTVVAVWKRLVHDGILSIANVTTVAMTLLLLATGPIYADAVSLAAARATLRQAPPTDSTVRVSVRAAPDDYEALDGFVGEMVTEVADPGRSEIVRSLETTSFRLPERPGADRVDIVVFRSVDAFADHAELVAGAWPDDARGASRSETIVAVDERTSATLQLAVGDRLRVTPTGQRGDPPSIRIAAVYRIVDRSDPYWTRLDDIADAGSARGQFRTHHFVTPAPSILAGLAPRLDAEWHLRPDPDELELGDLASLARATSALEDRLARELPRTLSDRGTVSAFQVETGLDRLLRDVDRSATVTRSSVFGVVFQLAVLAGYALMLSAAVALETRGRETSLLRSRGVRPRHLAMAAVIEAVSITAPLAILAPELAALTLRLLDDVGPLASINLHIAPRTTSLARVMTLGGAAAVVVVMVWPVVRSARRADRDGRSAREAISSPAQRAGVDLALLALAVVALWQLSTLGGDRATSVGGRFGVDPLLVISPALGLLAGAFIALRIVPPVAQLAASMAERARGAVVALVGWQLARRPSRYARTVLLLIAATAVGVLAGTATSTWRASQTAQATHQIGADARVEPNRRTGDSIAALHLVGAYESLDGVSAASPVARWTTELSGSERAAMVVAVDADRAPSILRTHDGVTAAAIETALAELAHRRPRTETIMLPGEPHAVAADVEVVETETILDGEPLPPVFSVITELVLRDGSGIMHRVPLGSVAAGEGVTGVRADLTAPVGRSRAAPQPPLSIVAIEARWTTPPVPDRVASVAARIELSSIVSIDQEGRPTPLPALDQTNWTGRAHPLGFVATPPSVLVNPHADGIGLTIDSGFVARPVAVAAFALPAGSEQLDALPVVVTERFLDGSGGRVGDRLRMSGIGREFETVEIVAAVPSFPTVDPRRNEALIADLPTQQHVALQPGVSTRPPDEYWLALVPEGDLDGSAVGTALSAAPFEVVTFEALDVRRDELATDPPAVGTLGAMSIGAVAATLFAIVGFGVSAAVSTRERAPEFATLRAVGLSKRQLSRQLAAEQSIVAATGIVIGLSIGLVLGSALLPRISLTQQGEEPFPRPVVDHPWSSIGLLVAVVLIATIVIVAGIHRIAHVDSQRARVGEFE